MKKLLLMFALLFTVSTSFISCRETEEEGPEEVLEERTDELEEAADEVEDEY